VVQRELDLHGAAGSDHVAFGGRGHVQILDGQFSVPSDGGRGLGSASVERLVHRDVVGEQLARVVVGPPVRQRHGSIGDRPERSARLDRPGRGQRVGVGQPVERLADRRRHVAVRHVGQRDEPDAAIGDPPHV
jgi:hypothetical protein